MNFKKIMRANESQGGNILIEIILSLAISGIIGLGASIASGQLYTQGNTNNDYTTASRNAMNAVHWISRDILVSQVIVLGVDSGFPLTLTWTEWDCSEHQVIYSIEENQIKRSYSIDGNEPTETMVAKYVSSASDDTSCEETGGSLIIKVTTTVGIGAHQSIVTKIHEVTPRPGL